MRAMNLRRLVCVSCLALAGGAFSSSVLADPPTIARSIKVDISDLDLNRPGDVRTLQHRIERAAREACAVASLTLPDDPPGYLADETCYRRAVQEATARTEWLALASKESDVSR